MYTILDLKNDLEGVLHGTTNNQIQNLDGVINRSARQLLLDVDPQETKRVVEFINPIFNNVYDYPIAVDVKGNKIIDIFPQVNRLPWDIWTQAYNQAFDVMKENIFSFQNMFTLNFNSSQKTLRINAPFLNPPVVINQMESLTSNGTWAASGTASNLTVNNTNYVQGAGSLQFDTITGLAEITNSTMSAVDLSAVENQSSLFLWVYCPVSFWLTSVTLRWGSSASDYYQLQVLQTQQATAFDVGWNLLQFEWNTATVVGSPDSSSITYVQVELDTTGGSNTAMKINGLNSILGTVLAYSYYSKYLFRNATTGVYQETVLLDSDLINLDTESYNLLFNKVAELAVQQQQGLDATFYDGPYFKGQYDAGVIRYKSMYKSELQKPQSSYYRVPNPRYSRYLGRWW